MDDKSIHHHFTINAQSVSFSTGDGMKTSFIQGDKKRENPEKSKQSEQGSGTNTQDLYSEMLKKLRDIPGIPDEVKTDFVQKAKGKENFSRKTLLGRLLTSSETISSLHYNGDFHQALGVNQGIKKFNAGQRDLGFQIKYCLSLMLTNRHRQAKALLDRTVSSVEDMGETFQSVMSLAENALQLDKNFEAAMFCVIAARMADMENLSISESASKSKCMAVLRNATGKISTETEQAKPFIQRYCVEAVRPLFEDVMKTATNEKNNLVELKIAAFHCMEILQLYADDDVNRAKTIERALEYLTEAYGSSFYSRQWFGNFSHNLGITYLKLSRQGEAASMLSQAFDVFTRAVDFDDDTEKLQYMTKTQDVLKGPGLGGLVVLDN